MPSCWEMATYIFFVMLIHDDFQGNVAFSQRRYLSLFGDHQKLGNDIVIFD